MRERMINGLLIVIVGLALGITLSRENRIAAVSAPVCTLSSLSTPAPTLQPVEIYRQERKETREKEIEMLKTLLADGDQDAAAMLAHMQQALETELRLEGALAGLGYDQAVCVLMEERLMIFMAQPVTGQQAQRLLEIAREISGLKKENIQIAAC